MSEAGVRVSRMKGRAVPALLLTSWSLFGGSLVGCYSYTPIVPTTPPTPVSGEVNLVLGARATESVRFSLGENISRISGSVTQSTADSLYVRVENAEALTGAKSNHFGVPVTLARADLVSVESRKLSKKRTWTILGVVAAVVVALASSIGGGASGVLDGGPTPGPV